MTVPLAVTVVLATAAAFIFEVSKIVTVVVAFSLVTIVRVAEAVIAAVASFSIFLKLRCLLIGSIHCLIF